MRFAVASMVWLTTGLMLIPVGIALALAALLLFSLFFGRSSSEPSGVPLFALLSGVQA
jgi:hypothetical protein